MLHDSKIISIKKSLQNQHERIWCSQQWSDSLWRQLHDQNGQSHSGLEKREIKDQFSFFDSTYLFLDVAALMDHLYISRSSAVRHNLQPLAPIQSSTSSPVAYRRTRGPVDKISLGPLSSLSQINSVVFRILRVFRIVWMIYGVLCQCPAHHSECHDNVYYPEQTLPPEGRFCRDYLFLGAINALTRLPSPECDARIK